MITQREIDDLVQELKDGGFYCAFVNKKLEEKFRLKSQLDGNTKQGFMSDLIVCRNSTASSLYFLSNKDYVGERHIQTEFTKSEIDEMPFDTNFFIKEEVK